MGYAGVDLEEVKLSHDVTKLKELFQTAKQDKIKRHARRKLVIEIISEIDKKITDTFTNYNNNSNDYAYPTYIIFEIKQSIDWLEFQSIEYKFKDYGYKFEKQEKLITCDGKYCVKISWDE